jgi:hypothetical protein
VASDKVRSKESQTSLNLIQESENETHTVKMTNVTKVEASLPVHFWIDIPNDFPWRNCLQEYNRALTPLHCHQVHISVILLQYNARFISGNSDPTVCHGASFFTTSRQVWGSEI